MIDASQMLLIGTVFTFTTFLEVNDGFDNSTRDTMSWLNHSISDKFHQDKNSYVLCLTKTADSTLRTKLEVVFETTQQIFMRCLVVSFVN